MLLVEDNLDAAESLGELLRIWGHEVTVAHDGAAALRAVPEVRPEVVLLDIGLPGMDGYEVASRLRATPGLAGLRLVAVTGYGQESDRRRPGSRVSIIIWSNRSISIACARSWPANGRISWNRQSFCLRKVFGPMQSIGDLR